LLRKRIEQPQGNGQQNCTTMKKEEQEEAILELIRDRPGEDYARRAIRRILAPPIRPLTGFESTRTFDVEEDRNRTDILLQIYQGWNGEPQFELAHQGFATTYPNFCKVYPDNTLKAFWELTKAAVRLFKWIFLMSWDEARVMDEFRAHYMIRIQEIKDLKTLPLGRTK